MNSTTVEGERNEGEEVATQPGYIYVATQPGSINVVLSPTRKGTVEYKEPGSTVSMSALENNIRNLFNLHSSFELSYIDEDGDEVCVVDEATLATALDEGIDQILVKSKVQAIKVKVVGPRDRTKIIRLAQETVEEKEETLRHFIATEFKLDTFEFLVGDGSGEASDDLASALDKADSKLRLVVMQPREPEQPAVAAPAPTLNQPREPEQPAVAPAPTLNQPREPKHTAVAAPAPTLNQPREPAVAAAAPTLNQPREPEPSMAATPTLNQPREPKPSAAATPRVNPSGHSSSASSPGPTGVSFSINLVVPSGEQYALPVEAAQTVAELKIHIQNWVGLPAGDLRLSVHGRELTDDYQTLAAEMIASGSTVTASLTRNPIQSAVPPSAKTSSSSAKMATAIVSTSPRGPYRMTLSRTGASQYSEGSVSGCTIMAIESGLVLLHGEQVRPDLVDRVLYAGSVLHSDNEHTEAYDMLQIPRYRNMFETRCEQHLLSNLSEVVRQIGYEAEGKNCPTAVILTRPPETLMLFSSGSTRFVIFDSHPRTDIPGAAFLEFSRLREAQNYLTRLWSPIDIDDADPSQMRMMNRFDATSLTLSPQALQSGYLELNDREIVKILKVDVANWRSKYETLHSQHRKLQERQTKSGSAEVKDLEAQLAREKKKNRELMTEFDQVRSRMHYREVDLQNTVNSMSQEIARYRSQLQARSNYNNNHKNNYYKKRKKNNNNNNNKNKNNNNNNNKIKNERKQQEAKAAQASSSGGGILSFFGFNGSQTEDKRNAKMEEELEASQRLIAELEADDQAKLQQRLQDAAAAQRLAEADLDAAAAQRLVERDEALRQQRQRDRELAEQDRAREEARVRQVENDSRVAQALGETPIFECPICGPVCEGDKAVLSTCDHEVCRGCMARHISYELGQGRLPRCSVCVEQANPDATISQHDITMFVKEDQWQLYSRISLSAGLLGVPVWQCPGVDCAGRVELDPTYTAEYVPCPVCNSVWCKSCNQPRHPDMTCQEFADSRDPDHNDRKFREKVAAEGWAECLNCGNAVEKTMDCNHMTCRCGGHFCYLCNKILDPSNYQPHFNCGQCPLFSGGVYDEAMAR